MNNEKLLNTDWYLNGKMNNEEIIKYRLRF